MTELSALGIVLFPALALRAMRTGGPASLWRTTGLGLALIAVLGLVLATPWAGNALVATYGYGYIALRTLLLCGITLGLPLLSACVAARIFAGARFLPGAYLAAVACAALAWYAAALMAIRILYTL